MRYLLKPELDGIALHIQELLRYRKRNEKLGVRFDEKVWRILCERSSKVPTSPPRS